jgi:hypothetical protein
VVASPVAAEVDLVDDLESDKNVNKLGGQWYTYDDRGSGGRSKVVKFKPASSGSNESKFSALLKGEVISANKTGYIGIGTNLSKDGSPLDISQYKGISFCAKGNGTKYYMKLRSSAIADYNDHAYTFSSEPQWNCYQIPFADMKQLDPKRPTDLQAALVQVSSIQWQPLERTDEEVELYLDEIKFIK